MSVRVLVFAFIFNHLCLNLSQMFSYDDSASMMIVLLCFLKFRVYKIRNVLSLVVSGMWYPEIVFVVCLDNLDSSIIS